MNLTLMRTNVRRDLKDEDASNYRWTNDEIDRHIEKAVKEFSRYSPREMMSELATVADSAQVDISTLTDRVSVDRVEFPHDETPRVFVRFELYKDVIYLLETTGDGTNCIVYWTTVHTLTAGASTIPTMYEELIAIGAGAFAALSISQFKTDKANYGGADVDMDYKAWGEKQLTEFYTALKKSNRKLKQSSMRAKEIY